MILGIDASNIRAGGGVTHLAELLRAAAPGLAGFDKVVVWACASTLARLDEREWLVKQSDPMLERGILARTFWQRVWLKSAARRLRCDVLFVPGGNDVAGFHPSVAMSQNMLPFEWRELSRFGFSLMSFRFLLLRLSQLRSFRHARGVIFLTDYAKVAIERCLGGRRTQSRVIPHGLNPRFFHQPRPQRPEASFVADAPCRLVYVSIVHVYKHQWNLVEAVAQLRSEGVNVVLDLIGPPASGSALLEAALRAFDPNRAFVNYQGELPYERLHDIYMSADIGVFASSCENLPNILLENMAAGLPVACSNMGPMPEVLGDAGVYFSPENVDEIAECLRKLIGSVEMRADLARRAFDKSLAYTWEKCAVDTLDFLAACANGARDDRNLSRSP